MAKFFNEFFVILVYNRRGIELTSEKILFWLIPLADFIVLLHPKRQHLHWRRKLRFDKGDNIAYFHFPLINFYTNNSVIYFEKWMIDHQFHSFLCFSYHKQFSKIKKLIWFSYWLTLCSLTKIKMCFVYMM